MDQAHPRLRKLRKGFLAVALVLVAWPIGSGITTVGAPAGLSLAVSGNRLVDGNGRSIVLRGVNFAGTEYACIQGWGIFGGPSDAASVAAIAAWHTNVVRIPLNEDCWLNINGVNPALGGTTYQNAVVNYVNLLHQNGLYAILDLHWNAPGMTPATGQQRMADADHAPAFWQSVATIFKNDPALAFDLYNEPVGIDWNCWLSGCTVPEGWQTAGMQSLVNAVRGTGATQPIMLGGVGWANDLSGWLSHLPADPLRGLVASLHLYNFSWPCGTLTCISSGAYSVLPVAAQAPVVMGELGENDCTHGFIDSVMTWADQNYVSYLGWTWNAWPNACGSGPVLITAADGTPTNFGIGLRDHLAAIQD